MINFLFEQISDLLLPLHMKYLISEANGSKFLIPLRYLILDRKSVQSARNAESVQAEFVVAFDL